MTRQSRQIVPIVLLAACLLSGCLPFRPPEPVLPPPTPKEKDPFRETRSPSFTTPPILTQSFPPDRFPADRFKDSQDRQAGEIVRTEARAETPATPAVKQPVPVKREPLAEALACVLENKHNEALACLQAYDPETQDLFLRLLPAVAVLAKKKVTDLSAPEVALLHEQLQTMLTSLRPRTPLVIDKACFCESVKGYGNYKPLPEGHAFAAPLSGRPGEMVQLYVELKNFLNEPRLGGYETRLSSSVEVADSRGELVWSYRFEDEQNPIRSRTQLHDWYNNYRFHIPKSLPPGTYRLTIQISDETLAESRRVARQSLEFRVAAPVR